jgi:hypothetical protein
MPDQEQRMAVFRSDEDLGTPGDSRFESHGEWRVT